MREDSLNLVRQGILTPSGDPNEPQLSEQYKKYLGSLPVLTILDERRAAELSLVGLTYGAAFLTGVCKRLDALGKAPLEPGTLQLACYDGEGVAYHVHEDYVPKKDYNPEDLPEHHRLSYKRRITATLYLQEDWQQDMGGAFRAHAFRPETDEPSPEDFVDILPASYFWSALRSVD
ncbi:abcG22, partial [Symbiodinium pilosum]